MQKYSATFLSWFVPVRADNEEILISVHASLSFVTEQIVTIIQQWDCLQGSGVMAGGPTLHTAPATARKLAEIVHFLQSNNDQTNYLINPLSITPSSSPPSVYIPWRAI